MLFLDAFKGHLTDSVKKQLHKMNTELVIPNRLTSVLQPMDVSINKPFKDRLRQQYLTWISDPARQLTETGKIKSASPSEAARWVSAAWKTIPESISSDLSRSVALVMLWTYPKMIFYGRTMEKITMIVTG